MRLTGTTGRVRLPGDYVASNVELAYAETSHATQGRTVEHSYLYLDGPTGTAGIYVPLGRPANFGQWLAECLCCLLLRNVGVVCFERGPVADP